jgi:hypothetical protein
MAADDQITRSLQKHGVPEAEIQEVMCASLWCTMIDVIR